MYNDLVKLMDIMVIRMQVPSL